jgi:hypothetical protein
MKHLFLNISKLQKQAKISMTFHNQNMSASIKKYLPVFSQICGAVSKSGNLERMGFFSWKRLEGFLVGLELPIEGTSSAT